MESSSNIFRFYKLSVYSRISQLGLQLGLVLVVPGLFVHMYVDFKKLMSEYW